MNVSEPFILRPVATTLLMVAIMLSGIVAYTFLPLSTLPEVDYPTIQVQTLYPGASPEVMTSSVTAPLERQFGQMPGLNQMTSASSGGASVITLQFSLDLSLDVAEQEVQAAINASGNLLPADLPTPPIYAKVNPADAPILTLSVTSKTLALTDLEDYSETRLAQKISQLTGVGLVTISGGQRPAVRIQLNPQSLAAYGLNIDDVRTTIGNLNVNTPKGNFDGPTQALTINANDQVTSADQYRNLIIAYRNGSPVRLSDVATIVRGPENTKLGAWANTTPAIIINVQRQPGANIIQVVDRIQSLLPQITASLPSAVDVAVLSNRTVTIRASVADVEFELTLAVVLVVLVIFVFLRTLPGTIIPSLSVPLVARRHVRSDVSPRLQPRQSVADGADHRHRLRRRRRHRHDREHRPPRRGRHGPARSGAARLGADRLHHHIADDLAARGADPAAVHGRRGRPAVSRILDHACRHHRDLRRRLADAGADDVRQAHPAPPGGRAVAVSIARPKRSSTR